jgi:hypothetical protein
MKTEEQIQKLASEYHKLIGGDHHKDRDCHWMIETKWSYGSPARYIVRHYGYVYDEVEIICTSYDGALAALREELKRAIEMERINKEQEEGAGFPHDDLPSEVKLAFEL